MTIENAGKRTIDPTKSIGLLHSLVPRDLAVSDRCKDFLLLTRVRGIDPSVLRLPALGLSSRQIYRFLDNTSAPPILETSGLVAYLST